VTFVPPVTHDPVAVAREVFEAARGSSKPVVGCFMSRDEVLDAITREARQDWVPVYLYPESAVRALAALDERRRILARPEGRVRRFRVARARAKAALGKKGWLGVDARRALCKAYGIEAVPGGLVRSEKDARALARRIGFPVAAKVGDPAIVHKSEGGGVLLDLADEAAVAAAFRTLKAKSPAGVNLQKMLRGGREVVVGVANDPAFGPILMFGLGGVFVEVLKDVSFAVCPVSDVRARELVRGIKGHPILAGVRGQGCSPGSACERAYRFRNRRCRGSRA
jgi:acetyltransferase